MKKFILVIALIILVIPSVAFASWWNPVSWFSGWFFSNNSDEKTVILERRIMELESKIDSNTINTSVSPTPVIVVSTTTQATTTSIILKAVKKKIPQQTLPKNTNESKDMPSNLPTETGVPMPVCPAGYACTTTDVAPIIQQPSSGTLCNGIYYSACSMGQKMICPKVGIAYCLDPQDTDVMQLHAEIDNYKQQTNDGAAFDAQRENSTECLQAKQDALSAYNAYNKAKIDQINKIAEMQNSNPFGESRDSRNANIEQYQRVSDVQISNLAYQSKVKQDKRYQVCDDVYFDPPKIYNTDCQMYGNTTSCTTY